MMARICWILWMSGSLAMVAGAEEKPAETIVGWDHLDGHVLLGELNCTSCHQAELDWILKKQAPHLHEVGGRVTPQYLRAFLSNPQAAKPGTSMPHLLHDLPAAERDAQVDALVHYLSGLQGPIDQKSVGSSLAEINQGKDLYHKVGCVACHQPYEPPPKQDTATRPQLDPEDLEEFGLPKPQPPKPAVPFGDLARKTTVDALAKFLLNPLHVRPSGRMPNLHLTSREARMIAAYLLRDQYSEQESAYGSGLEYTYYQGNFSKVPDFEQLQPKRKGEAPNFNLKPNAVLGEKLKSNFAVRFTGMIDIPEEGEYRFWVRSDDGSLLWIDGQVVVNNDGIHAPQDRDGKIQLTKGRHAIEAGLIQGGGGFELYVHWQRPGGKKEHIPDELLAHSSAAMIPKGAVDFVVNPAQAARGELLFGSLGCANCHQVQPEKFPQLSAPALAKLNLQRADSCLSPQAAVKLPQYQLSPQQRESIQKVLSKGPIQWTAKRRVQHNMTTFSCYACHKRGDLGGPDSLREPYFSYEVVVDLGDEGRLPPQLHEVGAKLTAAGFGDALYSGKRYRSYMATRMPNFGKANIGHLPEEFTEADEGMFKPYEPEFSAKLVEDGRFLVGKKALSCINCHAWGPYRLPGAEGLDFLEATRRLKPAWFKAWLLNPQKLRPGTRMPTAWPKGRTYFPDLQGGDVEKQIDAVWAYLAAGEKGGIPTGLSPDDETILIPTDEPIVFRTFLDKVSAHAITVGFPQRTHVAFDANRIKLAIAWTGKFVSTKPAWEGRAGQYAKVADEKRVNFPAGPPFAVLESLSDAWPQDKPKQKLGSNRSPDGWEFRGYRLNKDRVPTFLYELPGFKVEETPTSGLVREGAYLARTFTLTPTQKAGSPFYFRAAIGKQIEPTDDGWYLVDDRFRYRITAAEKPILREHDNQQELLVPIKRAAEKYPFKLEMIWE